MTTEFIHVVGSGELYTTPSLWETAMQSDITAATSKVFSHGGITGTVAAGNTVTGDSSGATATVTSTPTATQIYVTGISGTFTSGEKMEVSAGNDVTISDAGDDAIAVCELKAETFTDVFRVGGWTASATNYPLVRATAGAEYDHVTDTGAGIVRAADYSIDLEVSQFVIFEDILIGSTSWICGQYDGADAAQRFNRCTLKSDDFILNSVSATGRNFYACLIEIGTVSKTTLLRFCNLYNCTVICDNASGGTIRSGDCDNTVIINANTTPTNGNFLTCTGDYNAESNSSAAGPPGANSITDVATTDFNNFGSGDYTLSGTGADLYHAGSTLADPTLDHDGVSYDATNASIGAFEFVASSGVPNAVFQNSNQVA